MPRKQNFLFSCIGVMMLTGLAFTEPPLAEVSFFGSSVEFSPRALDQGMLLTVSAPDGSVVQKILKDGVLSFDLSELEGAIIDGRYKYQLVQIVSQPRQRSIEPHKAGLDPRIRASSLSGSFLVTGGNIVTPGGAEPAAAGGPDSPDISIAEDLCVGDDCVSGETYSLDTTVKLKETNTGIRFEDTSVGTWPTNDWHIRANDTADGGASYLQFRDVTANQAPFTIEAGAADHVLYVDSLERVGINTSTPAGTLHIFAPSGPMITMDQSSPAAYRWDMYADHNYWFLRDFASGTYPIVIEDNDSAPVYGLVLKSDGKFGQGTYLPTYQFEVLRTGMNSNIVVNRSDGATNYINATASFGNFGTVTDHPLRIVVNGTWQMRINNDSSISMANGAALTAGGVWTNASNRALKQDIEGLSVEEATSTLAGLEPVKFAYKANGERHVGFIAEDVPALVAGADRSGLSPMDVVAVLTRILQKQQQINAEQQEINNQLRARISALESW